MDPHKKVNPPRVVRCPSCENITPHDCVHREDTARVIAEDQEGQPVWDEGWWAILKCQTCHELSLYRDHWDNEAGRWGAKLLYPVPYHAPNEVPERIRRLFDEAVAVSRKSPSLCAVGIRRCLEGVVQDQGGSGRNLAGDIHDLARKGILPENLARMMETARVLGNLGAHAGDLEVTSQDVLVLIDFCLAVLEYVYVAPARIRVVEDRLIARRGKAIG